MPLSTGTRLGPYEILSALGSGGMGEVYRARDSKLNRDVALKILPDAFAADPDRLARFTREAQTLASLNHPNIAGIFGIDESKDARTLVMELVEGEDLSQRIARGAIPFDEALPIARQIADALEAAHDQGIIHRDLKPANIKVRPDGTVKVLDFGLAKAMDQGSGIRNQGSGPVGAMTSPTITTPAMTLAGMILGTAAYMSPEQARGRTVDKRSDIWAFGAVLYEMLAGARPFDGEDTTEVIAAVVKTTPDWSALPADVPCPIVTLIQRCLEKDLKARVGDIAAAQFLLANYSTLDVSPSAVAHSAPAPRSAWSRAMPWAISGALAAGLLGVIGTPWRAETPVDHPRVRLDVELGTDVSLADPSQGGSSVIISRDGTRLVYVSGTPARLFTRRLDQPKATELPGTQGASIPFFSADGQWVGFLVGTRVSKISVEGGAVVALGEVANLRGASWSEDGSIVVGAFQKGLLRIATGRPSESIAEPGGEELGLVHPEILPGGKAILFAADNAGPVNKTTIQVFTLADHQKKILIRGGASPRYLATSNRGGHLVYINEATLFAIPFDLDTLETRGTAVPIVDDVAHERLVGAGQFDISRTGTLVYRQVSGGPSEITTVQWVDPTGSKEPLLATPGIYQDPRVSPDGKRVALAITDGASQDLWVYDSQRDALTRLTFGGTNNHPTWSPDGRYVVYSNIGNGLFQSRADGSSQPQALLETKTIPYPSSFAPDGKRLAYYDRPGGGQLWTLPLEDTGTRLKAGKAEPFLTSQSYDIGPSFSPDGRWLAYQSNESGTNEVYVRAFPPPSSGQGGKWQISNTGGTTPRWSQGGHDLFYKSSDQIMAASYVANGDTFEAGKPRVWIAKPGFAAAAISASWDLSPDGKRVALLTPVEPSGATTQAHEVVFLLNFFDELRRRVPLK